LAWIQKHLDPNFTEFQLYKNSSQPYSVETSIPTKKQKMNKEKSLENEEDSEKTNFKNPQEKRVKDDKIQGKDVDKRNLQKQEKENVDFLERISIKSLIE
jgi:hypothetical protein